MFYFETPSQKSRNQKDFSCDFLRLFVFVYMIPTEFFACQKISIKTSNRIFAFYRGLFPREALQDR